MANINQGGISFNNYKTVGIKFGQNPIIMPIQGPDEDGGVVNAVDIDWNEAVLPNNDPETAGDLTISTTGELLRMIINTGSPMWAN